MKVAIVGHAADKFSPAAEKAVKEYIREVISGRVFTHVISGECPLGGVDIWAHEIADELDVEFISKAPKENTWEGGFKPRNIAMARECDALYNIVVSHYPLNYKGKYYSDYHCDKRKSHPSPHVKSGGCWTAWKAFEQYHKVVRWIIFDQKGNYSVWGPNQSNLSAFMRGE